MQLLVRTTLTLVCFFIGMVSATGEDSLSFTTISGREFKGVTVSKVDEDSITVTDSESMVRLPMEEIPLDVRRKMGIRVSALLDTTAETLEEIQAVFESEFEADRTPLKEFEDKYLTHLQTLHDESMKRGDLDRLILVEEEKESFRTTEAPDYSSYPQLMKLREIYERNLSDVETLVRASQKKTIGIYLSKLAERKKTLTQQGLLDHAKAIAEEERRIFAMFEKPKKEEKTPEPEVEDFPGVELLAHWRLDGDAKDSSGNGHDGTASSSGKFVDGRIGSGAFQAGLESYINIPDDRDLNLTQPFTITAWYKLDERASHLTWAPIVCKGYSTWRLQTGEEGNSVCLHLNNFRNKIHANSPESAVTKGIWQHVAGVFDGEFITLYVDGKPVAKEGRAGYEINHGNVADIRIGHNSQDERLHFQGAIDDVRIYSGTLTSTQINVLVSAEE